MGVLYRQAPIVGEEGCIHLDAADYVTLPLADEDRFTGGFSFLLDLQPDEPVEQVVFGMGGDDGASVVLTANVGDHLGLFRFEARDKDGRSFAALAKTSPAIGKRIFFRVHAEENELTAREIQPWAPNDPAEITPERTDGPALARVSPPVILGGIRESGPPRGTFVGRLAHFAWFDRLLDADRASAYRRASITRRPHDRPSLERKALHRDAADLLLDGYERLVRLTDEGRLSRPDIRDLPFSPISGSSIDALSSAAWPTTLERS